MNNRIKHLVEQATTIEVISGRGFDDTQYIDRFDKERFAELIIRECCQFEKMYGGDAGLVARSFGRKIREHFGVKE